jgi:short subunit dehydrogenase-like uncharacterized protein
MKKLMIYGAAGYTGGMAAEHAAANGLDLILAGRAEDRASLQDLGGRLGANVRLFSLDDHDAIGMGLDGVTVLLNAAGPFMHTASPLMSAAIRFGFHYLDFSAELSTYEEAFTLDEQAKAAGVMLLPGSGGSVAMLGSLAGHTMARVKNPQKISVALQVSGSMSRGSMTSATQNVVTKTLQLVDGSIVARSPDQVRDFDFGQGPKSSFPVTLPDLLTIHHATGVPNIETFVHVSAGAFPTGDVKDMPVGPSAEERRANRYYAAAEVTDVDGKVVRSILNTVNGYTFTAIAAAEGALRVFAGEARTGFQTPTGLFGHGFAETIEDTKIIDID